MLEKLDLEPLKFSMFVKNNQGYSTKFGGLRMILLIVLIILAVVAFGKELFIKQNPIVISSENYVGHAIVDRKNINIAVALMLVGGYKIENVDKYVEFNLLLADTDGSREKNEDKTRFTTTKLVPCENSSLFKENKYNITSNLISIPSTYSCFDENSPLIPDLEGSFGNPKFKVWILTLDYCRNTTENNNSCKSREEIQNYLPVFYVHTIMSDYYLDSKDLDQPLKETYAKKLLRVSTKNSRMDTFYYRTFNYFSDNGIILEDKAFTKGFYVNKVETDCLYDSNTSELLRVTWTLENIESIYERSYVKFQKVAADIGGFLKFITMILSFISQKYSIVHFYNYLFNHFQTKSCSMENTSIAFNRIDNKTKKQINNFYKDDLTNIIKLNLSANKLNQSNMKSKKLKEIDISIFDIVKFYLCCKYFRRLNVKRLILIKNFFKNRFTIENYIEGIENIEIYNKIRYSKNIQIYSNLVNESIFNKMINNKEDEERVIKDILLLK